MAAPGPENRFIAAVHRLLNPSTYREKMNNPYRGGTPDVYYEGPENDMWVEYKWHDPLPLMITPIAIKLSKLQQGWLRRADKNGRQTAVILGWRGGGVIFPGLLWEIPISRIECIDITLTKQEIAEWIETAVEMPRKELEG